MTPTRQGWTLLGAAGLFLLAVGLTLWLSGCAHAQPVESWDAGPDVPFCSQVREPWRPSMPVEDRQMLCEPKRSQEVAP